MHEKRCFVYLFVILLFLLQVSGWRSFCLFRLYLISHALTDLACVYARCH